MALRVIFDGRLYVHYGQAYVNPLQVEQPDFQDAFRGQSNGLCGAAEVGRLLVLTGLHTGDVGFRLEVCDQAPDLDLGWEEIVEVSFHSPAAADGELTLVDLNGSVVCAIPLQLETAYRARYCARGMDRGKEMDTILDDEALADHYQLTFWPAPHAPDEVLKQTSEEAAYWHDHARGLPLTRTYDAAP